MKPGKLPDDTARKILELRQHEKLSYQAIAESCKCSISTVRNIVKGRTRKDISAAPQ